MNAQAIQTAEILVRFANPAEDGKKPNIKSSDGDYYGVKPADFGRFQPGGRYRIDYTERTWKGRTYRDIVRCEPIRSESAATGDAAGARAPSPRRPSAGGEGVTGAPSEFEFVTRLLAAYVSCCGVENTVEGLVRRGQALREVYRQVFEA